MDSSNIYIHETNDIQRLRRFDLNLLLVFDALMQERNVTRAARRVFLSQPAMSNALKRLREMLDDPLLVRTAEGMQPTPRALALEAPIRQILRQLDQRLRTVPAFEPGDSERRFVIAMTDYGESLVLPALSAALGRQAPNCSIEAFMLAAELPEQRLEHGDLDLVIGVDGYFTVPSRLRSRPWLEDRLICLVRAGHPAARAGRLSLARYLAFRHVYPSPLGQRSNIVDDWLQQQGRQRSIAVAARSYWAAACITAGTDYVLSIPERIATRLVQALPLVMLEPPKGFPRFRLTLVWHPLYEEDGALKWLLALLDREDLLSSAALMPLSK